LFDGGEEGEGFFFGGVCEGHCGCMEVGSVLEMRRKKEINCVGRLTQRCCCVR
jgi:hypothetical protein